MAWDLVIGGERQVDLATIRGWRRFRQWAEKLSASEFPQIAHFIDENWSQELDDLAAELKAAMKKKKPTNDVRDIANVIMGEINTAGEGVESIFITDGTTDKEVEDNWVVSEDDPSGGESDDDDSTGKGKPKKKSVESLSDVVKKLWDGYP